MLRYAPGDGNTLYLAAANDFDGDRGALFISRDNGASWQKTEPGVWLKTPLFGLAVDPNHPDNVFYSSKIGSSSIRATGERPGVSIPCRMAPGTSSRLPQDRARQI